MKTFVFLFALIFFANCQTTINIFNNNKNKQCDPRIKEFFGETQNNYVSSTPIRILMTGDDGETSNLYWSFRQVITIKKKFS